MAYVSGGKGRKSFNRPTGFGPGRRRRHRGGGCNSAANRVRRGCVEDADRSVAQVQAVECLGGDVQVARQQHTHQQAMGDHHQVTCVGAGAAPAWRRRRCRCARQMSAPIHRRAARRSSPGGRTPACRRPGRARRRSCVHAARRWVRPAAPLCLEMAEAVCQARDRSLLTMPLTRWSRSRRPTASACAIPRALNGVSAGCITRAAFSAVSPCRTRMMAIGFAVPRGRPRSVAVRPAPHQHVGAQTQVRIRRPVPAAGNRRGVLRVARHADADQGVAAEQVVGRVEGHPAGTRQVHLQPGVGAAGADGRLAAVSSAPCGSSAGSYR